MFNGQDEWFIYVVRSDPNCVLLLSEVKNYTAMFYV